METDRKICIRNASVYDPSQGWDGEPRDIYMAKGVISPPFDDPEIIIDAGCRVTMAGGIDPNCHLALPGQVFVPICDAGYPIPEKIGRAYARMGFVHVHHPFTTMLMAHQMKRSLNLIPYINKSFGVNVDFRDIGKSIKINNYDSFIDEARAMIQMTGATGLFLAFPFLRHKQSHYVHKNISIKKTFEFFSGLQDPEIFPITLWGIPGLLETEIPTPERYIISGLSGTISSENSLANMENFLKAGGKAALGLNHGGKYLAIDCSEKYSPGTISIDAGIHNSYPLQYEIRKTALESDESKFGWMAVNSLYDSGRICLSSLSPPIGDIGRIPLVITWMVSRDERPESVDRALGGRVFGFADIALLTRLEPARQLGFNELGHLKIGAAANIAVYDLQPNMHLNKMVDALSNCWCLIKDGITVRLNGDFSDTLPPSIIRYRKIDFDPEILKHTALLQNPTLRLENLSITEKMAKQ